ncbi:putative competence-damaged protein [Octadecabacter arcticus 238]|uniref:Putative competence-damaged protein n=1 Tax=Octadecabacter arcticus 238 TaxID=391616 RepID=M9RHH6_9RHOB|nr:CinA family protein [Octadecabacter arcticus]AGI72019.1 putative competence-damaged protein [Octadecabacter arcticus 238]
MTLAAQVVAGAIAKGMTITTAESCTGGLVSAALTDIAGSSAVFERGFVTYSNAAKVAMVQVDPATLEAFGAVSEQVAEQMARGARRTAMADIAVSITGIAGPGGSDFKPEGRVCFGLDAGGDVQTVTHEFGPLGRTQVRARSVQTALTLLQGAIDSL